MDPHLVKYIWEEFSALAFCVCLSLAITLRMTSFWKYISTALIAGMSPTIFTRIKQAFSGGPAHGTVKASPEQEAKDKEALEKAVTEAVAAGLKNEDFLKAVAAHLATQLQPSLKALDFSTTESKLLSATDDLAKRNDEQNTQTTAKLEGISTLVETTNSTTAKRITTVEEAVNAISAALAELGSNVKTIQAQVATPDIPLLAAHTEKLDTIAAGVQSLQAEAPAPVTTALTSQASKLDSISEELAAIKGDASVSTTLSTISTDLAAIKGDVSVHTTLGLVTSDLAAIKTDLAAQNSTLDEIKSSDSNAKILGALETSQASHAAHTAALSELKTGFDSHATSLGELKSADTSPEILAAVKSSNESHAAHATALSAIKSDLESHGATLGEVKTATSTPAPAAEKVDISGLESSINSVLTSVDSQSATLAEIKESSSAAATTTVTSIEAIKTDIASSKDAVISKVVAVETAIHAIPAPVPGKDGEILSEVKEIKTLIATSTPVAVVETKAVNAEKEHAPTENGVKEEDQAAAVEA